MKSYVLWLTTGTKTVQKIAEGQRNTLEIAANSGYLDPLTLSTVAV